MYKLIFTVLMLGAIIPMAAQQTGVPVKFVNGDFITGDNITRNSFKTSDLNPALANGRYYVLIQFSQLPSTALQKKMQEAGISLGSFIPGNAYLAAISSQFNFSTARSYNISSINVLPAFYKIHRALNDYDPATAKKDAVEAMAVTWFAAADKAMVTAALQQAGAVIASDKFSAGNLLLLQYNRNIINSIAALPFINSIGLQPITDQPLNYNSRASEAVSGLNAITGKNLNGKGVAVGVGDDADVSTHIDFANRLINRSPWVPSSHGTHTTGTTAGAGIINVKNRGIAAKATIISQYFSDIIVNSPTYITDYSMMLTNNSYHSAETNCNGEREYNDLSRYGDYQMYNYNHLQHVFASGNDGSYTCSPYPSSFGTLKSGWQTAKNILTVGALRVDVTPVIASFSSRGPAMDGRIKPEITANGSSVLSTITNNRYGLNSGTSMACPAVTGGLTLMYERYRQLHGNENPGSALIKALACNTAEDLGNPGPDYTYGFGMLNVRRAVEAMDSSRYFISDIANAGSNTHNFMVPEGTRRLKVMLYWNDVAAASNAATSLVNDLDMVVIEPSLALHRPMTLNPNPASVNAIATEAPDHLNNIEQVVIENPAAGVYSANINGYSVPSGSQNYVVTYEILKYGVTVEYPYGGETLVPGDTEIIRWNGYGLESNSFTLEYSTDNGTSWITIDNNVSSATRAYSWIVPTTFTNQGLMRVTRNGSSLTDQSDQNFSILGQPVVTATNACIGAVQLDWAEIPGATSYDILQLDGDSMKVIGNKPSLSYLIRGLDKNSTYWFGVAARNGAVQGRRSVSVSIVPNSGACTLSNFVNDLRVDSILEPNSARQFFANAGNAAKPVKISIKNPGPAAITGPYNVSFDYGGTVVTETVNTTINAGGTLNYTFTGMYPTPSTGYQYNFKAWVTKAGDANSLNDTAFKTVKLINNDAITTLPLAEGFESMPVTETRTGALAFGGNKYLDFFASTSRGRARTFVNTGFALAGNRALTLDQAPYNATATTDSALLNYNLSLFNGRQVRFDFYYKNHGQTNENGNRVWVRGSESNQWIEAYNLYDNQGGVGEWKKGIININEILNSANPAQNFTSTFQVKLGQKGYATANSPYPMVDIDDGYTFDNLVLNEANNDVAVLSILAPDKSGCGLDANSAVSIRVKNYTNSLLNNLQVFYQVNNGTVVTENIPSINAGQSLDYVFTQRADFSAFIDYSINVWVKYPTDTYGSNDSVLNYKIHNSPIITNYPYLEGFENNNGDFYTSGTNSTWQWGVPSKTTISKAANGTKIWTTNLNGNYSDNETSYLYTPCFDLNNLRRPVLSFSHIFDIETDFDYTWVEYSTDGKNWNKLGTANAGTNWYDNAVDNNWRTSNTKWHVASLDIPVTNTTVKFRFVMSSDAGVSYEGIGIDDVRVHEKKEIAGSPTPLTPATLTGAWPDTWVPFNYGDSLTGPWWILGEINTHGQDLDSISIIPYLNLTGTVRSSNNEYYLDKNFVIRSNRTPASPISVRLYFSDQQANDLIGASGCSTCGNLPDAYAMAVTRYKGSFSDEDSSLLNNNDGYYQFIPSTAVSIIPHEEGYYAEFSTSTLGEFWLGKADITPASQSLCQGGAIVYTAPTGAATYQWQVNTGAGYTNISNNSNYTGVTAAALQVSNLPTATTGYTYRCLVNGIAGTEYTLRFKNIWTGGSSTSWFAAANWSCGTVPDEYTDVVIPGDLSRYPVLTGDAAVRTLRVLAGVPFVVNAGVKLEVKGK